MSDQESPLAAQALKRLRSLAEGNGLKPDAIMIVSAEEKNLELGGTLTLTPRTESKTARGNSRTVTIPKGSKNVASFAELANFATQEQATYAASESWYDDMKSEIDALPGHGWGLDNSYVTHDKKPAAYASASETCPTCTGKGLEICQYCRGQRYTSCLMCMERGFEPCYNCFGSGREPQNQEYLCRICNGSMQAVCRTCQGQRGILCASCKASGTVPCAACAGTGQLIEVCTVTYGADMVFSVGSGSDFPAAARRAFDRHGIVFLTKGHADISCTRPGDEQKSGMVLLRYTAKMPCADMVVNFAGDRKRIAVLGLKRLLLDVPDFLDGALAEGIEALGKAAKDGNLSRALEFRTLHDACHLILKGQGDPKNLRRLYPHGLSKDAILKIMRLMRVALRRTTVAARYTGATLALLLAAGIGATLAYTPHMQLGLHAAVGIEAAAALISATLGYLLTSKAAAFKLHRMFPDTKTKSGAHGGMLALAAALTGFALPFAMELTHPATAAWLKLLGWSLG